MYTPLWIQNLKRVCCGMPSYQSIINSGMTYKNPSTSIKSNTRGMTCDNTQQTKHVSRGNMKTNTSRLWICDTHTHAHIRTCWVVTSSGCGRALWNLWRVYLAGPWQVPRRYLAGTSHLPPPFPPSFSRWGTSNIKIHKKKKSTQFRVTSERRMILRREETRIVPCWYIYNSVAEPSMDKANISKCVNCEHMDHTFIWGVWTSLCACACGCGCGCGPAHNRHGPK